MISRQMFCCLIYIFHLHSNCVTTALYSLKYSLYSSLLMVEGSIRLSQFHHPQHTHSTICLSSSQTWFPPAIPVGVLLRKEDEGVIGGVTGGVRLPLAWRGGVAVLFLDTPPVMDRDSLGVAFFFMVSCSRRAASVMNLMTRNGRWWWWHGGGGRCQ